MRCVCFNVFRLLLIGFLFALAPLARADVTLAPLISSGLSSPVDIASANDGSGRLFVVQQAGQIRVIQNGILLTTPFLNLASGTAITTGISGGERGLLGLAFHPQYASNGQFFVYFTATPAAGAGIVNGDIVIARFQRSANDPNVADPASRQNIIVIPHHRVTQSGIESYGNHNGGALRFGPDGHLYAGIGDGGSGGDPFNAGQDLNNLLGKIIRLDINAATYSIPANNPFAGGTGPGGVPARPEIWAYGVRNPWRLSFDRQTGNLYIGDVGQGEWEEINFQAAGTAGGANYGWRIREGNHCYNPSTNCGTPTNYVAPLLEYSHGEGVSVTGGYVYRGQSAPDLAGKYVFGDFAFSRLWFAPGDAGAPYTLLSGLTPQVSTFGEGENGELYLANYSSGSISSFSSSQDMTPDQIVFFPANNIAIGASVVSNLVRITGLGTATPISIMGGEYSIASGGATSCGASYTPAAGTINSNSVVCVRHTSANSGSTDTTTILTIGTAAFTFRSTTVAAPLFSVTPSAGSNGSISPSTPQSVTQGATAVFTVTANTGFVASVGGTCGGSLAGNTYTTLPITAHCTVIATFNALPPNAPGAPVIGVAIAGDGQATIHFSPPSSDGGAVISSYQVTCNPGGISASAGVSPITVTGLTNGDLYSCSATASNIAGTGPASATVNVTPVASPPLSLVAVLSRKTHGAAGVFDIPIDTSVPIGGAVTVESRAIGAGHTLVFQFNQPINATGTASAVNAASNPVGTINAVATGSEVTVTLAGVGDNQRATVTLDGVNGTAFAAGTSIGFLVGDVNNSRSVNASDIAGVKARSGQTANAANFRFDLNSSGGINATDISAVKARSGLVLP